MKKTQKTASSYIQFIFRQHYADVVGFILFFTGFTKLIAFFGEKNTTYFDAHDTVFFFVNLKTLTIFTGIIEILVATLILSSLIKFRLKYIFICWLTAAFVAYRIANHFLAGGHCNCLGHLEAMPNILGSAADALLKLFLFYIISGILFNAQNFTRIGNAK